MPPSIRRLLQQRKQLLMTTGCQHCRQARDRTFEVVGPSRVRGPDTRDQWLELLRPFERQFRPGAQFTPVVGQGFDIGHVIVFNRLPKPIEPTAAQFCIDLRGADQRH